jgi:hypothetical protein
MSLEKTSEAVREAFVLQAKYCRGLGSPFTARLCRMLGERLTADSPVGERVLGWRGNPDAMNDSVPLRLAGAVQAIAMRGTHPSLAKLYPPNPLPDKDVLWCEIQKLFVNEAGEILRWLELPPQTNEVGRSAVLMAGLLVIAAETNRPLALYEIGSSGGLNLMLDRYSFRLGTVEAGAPGSTLRLEPEWSGPALPNARAKIIRRRGVDILPLDLATASGRERLRAYIWPDQPDRHARTNAAIQIAAAVMPRIDKADAAEWTEQMIKHEPELGVARVVMHSIAFQYFPKSTQRRIGDHLARAGANARADAPLSWLRMEGVGKPKGGIPLTLTTWPGGTERELAVASAHGSWIEWH